MGIFAEAFVQITDSFGMIVIDLSQKHPACWGGKLPPQLKRIGSRFPAFLLAQKANPQIAAKISAGSVRRPVGSTPTLHAPREQRAGRANSRPTILPTCTPTTGERRTQRDNRGTPAITASRCRMSPTPAAIKRANADIQGRRRRFRTADMTPTAERWPWPSVLLLMAGPDICEPLGD